MRSIERRFKNIQKKNEGHGACEILAKAIRNQKFNQDSITREFTKLVPKDEYAKNERRGLIKWLTEVSNTP